MNNFSNFYKIAQSKLTVRKYLIIIDQLRQMAIFSKVIDHGSFRGAAKELRLSPSVVSHHISDLESHLGVTLLYRSTRKLKLTLDGERLLSAVRNMLGAVEEEFLNISGTAKQPSGELKITIPSSLSQSPFTDAIGKFSQLYPRIHLLLDYSDTRRELVGNGIDLAFRMGIDGSSSATSCNLLSVRRRLISSKAYIAEQASINSPHQLKTLRWLALSPVRNRPYIFRQNDTSISFKPDALVYSNDIRSIYQLVSAGTGIAIVPDYLLNKGIDRDDIKILLPDWELDSLKVYAEWPNNVAEHALSKLLVNFLRKEMC